MLLLLLNICYLCRTGRSSGAASETFSGAWRRETRPQKRSVTNQSPVLELLTNQSPVLEILFAGQVWTGGAIPRQLVQEAPV